MKSEKITAIPQNDSFKNEDLPEDWNEVPLSKILLTLESGSRPKGGVRGIETGIPSVGGEHLNDRGGFRFEKIKYIPLSFFENMRRGRIQTDDILIVKDGATTGKVSLVRSDFPYNPAMVNEHVFLCRFIEGIYSPFVFYFLFSQVGQNRILENFQGSAQGGINQTFAENTIVPIPTINEQQRIVVRIEALLTHINLANDRLSRVPLIMKRFRQAVLAAACSGRLTERWREENLQSLSDHINQKILQKMERKKILHNFEWDENFTLPPDWILTFIEIVAKVDTGTTPSRKNTDYWDNASIPWVTSGELYDSFITDTKEKISEIALKETRLKIFPKGTLLIALYGQGITRGKSSELLIEATTNQACGTINVFDDFSPIKPYLKLYLQKNYDDIRKLSSGGVQPNINSSKIKSMPIPLPPLAEQHEIIRQVNALFERADAIEREIGIATKRTEGLTQAILGKAFRGQLSNDI